MSGSRALLLYVAGAATGFLVAMLVGAGPDPGRLSGRTADRRERAPSRDVENARFQEPSPPPPPSPRSPTPGGRGAAGEAPAAGGTAESEEAPEPGTRLPDGRIVGGATWNRTFVQGAVGMLDSFFAKFLEEADLSPEQVQRLKAEMDASTREAMQVMADFINGDVDADRAYESFSAMASIGREKLRRELDDRRFALYQKFEGEVTDYFGSQVVSTEVATLREELGLDAAQESAVTAVVRERYARVQAEIGHVIPNFMFRPIRRGKDAPIYAETAGRIAELLRPEQMEAFRRHEQDPHRSFDTARPYLVPKG